MFLSLITVLWSALPTRHWHENHGGHIGRERAVGAVVELVVVGHRVDGGGETTAEQRSQEVDADGSCGHRSQGKMRGTSENLLHDAACVESDCTSYCTRRGIMKNEELCFHEVLKEGKVKSDALKTFTCNLLR